MYWNQVCAVLIPYLMQMVANNTQHGLRRNVSHTNPHHAAL